MKTILKIGLISIFFLTTITLIYSQRNATPVSITQKPQLRAKMILDASVSSEQISVVWVPALDSNHDYLGVAPDVSVMIENNGTSKLSSLNVSAELLDENGDVIGNAPLIRPINLDAGKFFIIKNISFWHNSKSLYFKTNTNLVVKIIVDPTNKIKEDDETNNMAKKLITAVRYQ